MEWLTIKRNNRRTRKLFTRYFNYEWAKNIKKRKVWIAVYPLALVLFVLNLFTPHELDDYNYYFFRFCMISILAYIPMVYMVQFVKLMYLVGQITADTEHEFQFRFDEEGIFYRDSSDKLETSWSELTHFSVNKNCVYLYNSQGRLRELISKEVIGGNNFKNVLELAKTKLNRRRF